MILEYSDALRFDPGKVFSFELKDPVVSAQLRVVPTDSAYCAGATALIRLTDLITDDSWDWYLGIAGQLSGPVSDAARKRARFELYSRGAEFSDWFNRL